MDMQTELMLAGRLALAAFLGLLIGYERELRGRSAGLRTFAAVALGSCLFSIISYVVAPEGNETTRVAAQVVTGVGFLGAGVILHGTARDPSHISGLTTSATLWAAAAVGMAVGYGLYILAVAGTLLLLLLLLLRLVPGLERPPKEGE